MLRLDAIKYKARGLARRHDGDTYNFNPFARVSSRTRKPDDEENKLRQTRSEAQVESSLESDRRRDNRIATEDFGGPPHADTAPPDSASSPTAPEQPWPNDTEGRAPPQGANGALASSTAKSSSETGPKRRKWGFLSKGSDKEPENEVNEKEKAPHPPITTMSMVRHTIFGSWINVLLLLVPVGFAVNYARLDGVAIFVINFIAIIPLAGMLSYATEELAMRVGETLGGLVNATFG
jgi:Ca2+:H+ antiporter